MKFKLLAVIATMCIIVVACGTTAGRETEQVPPASTDPSTTTTTGLPQPAAYTPLEGEPEPQAKKTAADVVQALTTYPAVDNPGQYVGPQIAQLGAPADVVRQSPRLLVSDRESTGEIVYPQYGGLTDTEASVMVVVKQRLWEPGETTTTVERIVDVRMALEGAVWRVTGIDSDGGVPVEEPDDLPASTRRLLASTSAEIPDSSRWDIYRGDVDQRIIDFLAELSETHTFSVAVIKTGHPANVFATDRESNHTRGRAVDVWKIDGTPVLQLRGPGSPIPDFLRKVRDMGLTELGSPVDIDGPGGISWTDRLHQDHMHLAYKHPVPGEGDDPKEAEERRRLEQ
jgi:hypothetical protein